MGQSSTDSDSTDSSSTDSDSTDSSGSESELGTPSKKRKTDGRFV